MISRDCDFIPPEYHEQRRVHGMIRQRAAGLSGVVAIMLIWMVAHHFRVQSAEAIVQDVAAQKAEIEQLAQRKAEMEAARNVLTNLQNLMSELAGNRSLVAVFGELSQRIPDSIVLTGCQVYEPSLSDFTVNADDFANESKSSPWKRSAAMARGEFATKPRVMEPDEMRRGLTLYGVARSIPDIIEFAAELDKSPAFYEVDMDVRDPMMFAGQPARRFRMTCRIAEQSEGRS